MYGSNLGRAIAGAGDDLVAYNKIEASREAQLLRDARERELGELKLSIQKMGLEMRANALDGQRRAGAKDVDGGWVPDQPDDRVASIVNSWMQPGDDPITGPRVAGVRRFTKDGPQSEVKATAETPGMEYLDSFDRANLEAKGGMKGDTAETMQARRDVNRVSRGIVAASMDPKVYDDFQKGVTHGTARDLAFSNDPAKQDLGRRGQRAMKGDTRFNVDGDEKIDEMDPNGKGFKGQTAQGAAKTNEANAKAEQARATGDLRDRTDPNARGGRGGGGGANTPEYKAEKELLDKVERELEKAKASLSKAEDNQVNALGESARKAAKALIDKRGAELQELEARAKEHRERMQRIADGAPRGTPPVGGDGANEQQLRALANSYISRGASPEAVKARFKQLTGKDL